MFINIYIMESIQYYELMHPPFNCTLLKVFHKTKIRINNYEIRPVYDTTIQ